MDQKKIYPSEEITLAQTRLSLDPVYHLIKGEISRLIFNGVPNLLFINYGKSPKYVYHTQIESAIAYYKEQLIRRIIADYPELICTEPFLSSEVISPWKDSVRYPPEW